MKYILFAITLPIVMGGHVQAQETYVAPLANKIMFEVDKLPLDKGLRWILSKNLTILVKRKHNGSAREHRLTGQILILAMRIHRENKAALELSSHLASGGELPVANEKERGEALKKVRRLMNALSRTKENGEAKILEAYLKDLLLALDETDPLVDTHVENASRWAGVLPAAVQSRQRVPKLDSDSVDLVSGHEERVILDEVKMEDPVEASHQDQSNVNDEGKMFTKWTKQKSVISSPFILVEKLEYGSRYSTEMVALHTVISPRLTLDSSISIALNPRVEPNELQSLDNELRKFFKILFGDFESIRIEVTTDGRLSSRNKLKMLLPLGLQMMASEKDIQIREGVGVMGHLKGKAIVRNSDFWHTLKILRKSDASNQRLLIPDSTSADFRQLVALEEEDFFVRNEVLAVSSIDEAFDLLAQSSNDNINEASREFAKIQKLIGGKSVGPFAVNKQVREKLAWIIDKNPKHISAKMILLRGNASRSRTLETYFIATELAHLLEKTSHLNDQPRASMSAENLSGIADEIEKVIEELDLFIDSDDRELVTYLSDIADYLATISRNKEKRDSIAVERMIENALNHFKITYLKARTHLDEELGKSPTP